MHNTTRRIPKGDRNGRVFLGWVRQDMIKGAGGRYVGWGKIQMIETLWVFSTSIKFRVGVRLSRKSPSGHPASIRGLESDSLKWTLASRDVWTKDYTVWLVGLLCSFYDTIFKLSPIFIFSFCFLFFLLNFVLFVEVQGWRMDGIKIHNMKDTW